MQAGMPAKSCRKGLATRQLQMQEEAEETQWSFFCRAGICSPLVAPASAPPCWCHSNQHSGSHRLLWTEAEIEVEDLAKRQNEGSHVLRKYE